MARTDQYEQMEHRSWGQPLFKLTLLPKHMIKILSIGNSSEMLKTHLLSSHYKLAQFHIACFTKFHSLIHFIQVFSEHTRFGWFGCLNRSASGKFHFC